MGRILTAFLVILVAMALFGWVLAAITALFGAAFWLVTLPFRLVGEAFVVGAPTSGGQVLVVLAIIGALYVWHRHHHEGRSLSFATGIDDERWERKVRRARRHWNQRHEHIADFGDKASERLHRWSVRWRARHRPTEAEGGTE